MWGMIALTAIVMLITTVLAIARPKDNIVVLCLIVGSCNMTDPQLTVSAYDCEEKQ